MGILPDGAGGGSGGLDGMEGGATGGERSTEKGVGQVGAECTGVTVVDQSVDWNASFASRAWSILWAAAYQASGSVSAGCLKGVRATRAEHSRRFLSLNYVIEYVTTHLQEIPQRIR